ncbi:protein of unknown function [Lentzea xinjiangensis]|uniref:DUF3893 domain-containing protein n=1 Tax=Lentzea xinjiangensis TaxID=402600 RepID=A0A1H9T1Z9_9PSEU|nr:RNaseH domain-containing protein [Lentzea xinjiangensis]SER91292.1 protein of unknown function [Lentzea xinjiangensis]
MLITLSYPVPRAELRVLLGDVTVYPLTEEFSQAWDALPTPSGRPGRQPYASLATGLTAATGQPVRLFGTSKLSAEEIEGGDRMLLITDKPFDDKLPSAVAAWERHVRKDSDEQTLADLLPSPEAARPLAEHVVFRDGAVPVAPGWVFRVATWQVMRRLSGTRLAISGQDSIRLRLATDGSVLAWHENDLLRNGYGVKGGMVRLSARLTTRAGIEDFVLCFTAVASPIASTWNRTKNVWIDRRVQGAPVLHLPLKPHKTEDGQWTRKLEDAVPKILEVCDLKTMDLPRELPAEPGDYRPIAPVGRQPVGPGLGARFMLRLHKHLVGQLPALRTLSYAHDKRIVVPEREKPDSSGLSSLALDSTGFKRLTIMCLYDTTEARDRMEVALSELARRTIRLEPKDPPVVLDEGVEVVARWCPELLQHGPTNRNALIDDVLDVEQDEDHLVEAWLETKYHPDVPVPAGDAKPHLRTLLAHRKIPSQFLATAPALPAGTKRPSATNKKHAARAALLDLLRGAGIVDQRIFRATTREGLGFRLDRDALLVGLHVRRQQVKKEPARLVVTMVALHARTDADLPWRLYFTSGESTNWQRAAHGIAHFNHSQIGSTELGRSEEKAARTRKIVGNQLRALVSDDLAGTPLVLFVDAVATRTIWPGLADLSFGTGALPGDGLDVPVAIVRLNDDLDEIGRPVSRTADGSRRPADEDKPAAPGQKVYRLSDSAEPVWMFPRISRSIDTTGGRIGLEHTRWSLPGNLAHLRNKPWHSFTATEIAVVSRGVFDPVQLAALAARLCQQPVSWDGRTSFPVPLHLAVAADKDHPSYRAASEED